MIVRHVIPLLLFTLLLPSSATAEGRLGWYPETISLSGQDATQGLLVERIDEHGHGQDLTHVATYRSLDETVCSVDQNGIVTATGNGTTIIEATVDNSVIQVPIHVANTALPPKRHFQTDVVPILTRYACNSSGCHGKAEGQNGFKLSVFGFDPVADYAALVQEGRGRRVVVAAPDRSLLLTKASGVTAHGGGVRLEPDMHAYQAVRDWIAAGAKFDTDHPEVERIELYPRERILDFGSTQQVRLMAHFDDGTHRDVTPLARFHSNNEALATVNDEGFIQIGSAPGHVAIMASFLEKMETLQILIPNPPQSDLATNTHSSQPIEPKNFIDRHIDRRLGQLNLLPSGQCDDATYLRRVYLDIIGTLPTPAEARKFLDDPSENKRALLVDELLERPEYATYWSLKWSDTLRVDREILGHKAAYAYYRWIRENFENNRPLNEFAAEIIAANGAVKNAPQANFYKAVTESGERSAVLSQVFLGLRLECAECHHHPFDRISQTDYHGMRAFFETVSLKPTARGEMMMSEGDAKVKHPRSGDDILARPLYGAPTASEEPRRELATWMTSTSNPWFSKNISNRIWAHFMGRGLVEPVDDFRATNPPSNPELLDGLSQSFVESGFDAKTLIREIVASNAYQRSTTPNASNVRDEQNYSRALFRRLDAEVLLDAICQVTGVPEKFEANPLGIRAIELWDSGSRHYFLKLFGRPFRKTACECERNVDASVAQVLHVLNSSELQNKLSHPNGQLAQWANDHRDNTQLVDELYLAFYGRRPTEQEVNNAVNYLTNGTDRKTAVEDLGWSLLNSYEFLFNR